MDSIFKKFAITYKCIVIVAIAIITRIVYIQFINPTKISDVDIAYRTEVIEANRGDILSCDGRPLATSVPYYQVRLDCTVSNKDTFNK